MEGFVANVNRNKYRQFGAGGWGEPKKGKGALHIKPVLEVHTYIMPKIPLRASKNKIGSVFNRELFS